jgi:hypothetical protein
MRREWRSPEGIEAVRSALVASGISPTSSGAASLSAEVGARRFSQLFGAPPEQLQPSSSDVSLTLPEAISHYVETITIAPQHILFRE